MSLVLQPPFLPPPRGSQMLLLPRSSFRRLLLQSFRCVSAAPSPPSSSNSPPPPPPQESAHFVVDYLVCSCGLSRAEAARASLPLAHLKSAGKPDAVVHLLKQEGLDGAQIRRLVLSHPRVLVADAQKTLEPKIRALRESGFSGPELARLITASPSVIRQVGVLPRIEFWRNLVGTNENLLKALERCLCLLHFRLENRVVPNLSLLRNLGITDDRIGTLIVRRPRLMTSDMDKIKAAVEQVRSMGIPPDSTLFVEALYTTFFLSRSMLDAKFRFLSSFGWSKDEILLAFQRFPRIFGLSEKKIRTAMDFLLKEAGCESSYVARRSVLLGYSMERRLMPRYGVLRLLKMRGLRGGDDDFYSAILLSEKKFVDKYVISNTETMPDLLEMYPAAAGSKSISS